MLTNTRNILSLLLLMAAKICCSQKCEPWMRVKMPNAKVMANGSAWDPDGKNLYPPEAYWKEDGQGGVSVIYGCPCMLDRPCLRKCCQRSEAMDNVTLECIPHDEPWPWFRPNVSADEMGNFRKEGEGFFSFTFGNFCQGMLLEPDHYPLEDEFYLNFTDGTLSMTQRNRTGVGPMDFCLEYLPRIDAYLPYLCVTTYKPYICDIIRNILYPLEMLISIVLLLISLSVYIIISELRNLHGKCLMCHIISLLFAYTFLTIVQGFGERLNDNVCVAFGFLIYFSLLCTFSWLNVVCFDICITVGSSAPSGGISSRNDRKFLLYQAYAWGVPLVILTIAMVMEMHPGVPDSFIKPDFKHECFFGSADSRIAYFIAPVGIIVLCNLILFLLTAWSIYIRRRNSMTLEKRNSGSHDRNDLSYKLYIKLSIAMGMSWILEIISTLIGGSSCYWLITDSFNTLQGLFIFVIFICKRNVKNLLLHRFFPNLSGDQETSTSKETML